MVNWWEACPGKLEPRGAAIKIFKEDPDCRVFLMSLKTGGVALNLTGPSHVFMMDLWWNPAAERQAQDRIYRIWQYKPIRSCKIREENNRGKDTIAEKKFHRP